LKKHDQVEGAEPFDGDGFPEKILAYGGPGSTPGANPRLSFIAQTAGVFGALQLSLEI
jgi:hypothetical protein